MIQIHLEDIILVVSFLKTKKVIIYIIKKLVYI